MTDVLDPPTTDGVDGEQPTEWSAPAEPRKRRWWVPALWIGVPVVAVAAGAWIAGTNLIAPGVTVAGVPVGGMTESAAAAKIDETLATTAIDVRVGDETATLTGADLGATVASADLAAEAMSAHPLWNIGDWYPAADDTTPVFTAGATEAALVAAFPGVQVAPQDAVIAYDGGAHAYTVTPGVDGAGIDAAAVQNGFSSRLLATTVSAAAAAGSGTESTSTVAIEAPVVSITPAITTDVANTRAEELNGMVGAVGFYIGDERTVPIDVDVAASWLTIVPDPEAHTISVTANAAAIQAHVDGLQSAVNRDAQDATVITNAGGEHLRAIVEGQTGRTLESTDGIAEAFAQQLADGKADFQLDVTEVPYETTTLARLLEVDLSEQRLYLKENGAVVDSWLISSGREGPSRTIPGRFTINWHVRSQTMTGTNFDTGVRYDVPNVEWVMYFNGDQAFHGAYWHDNFGNRMSNGCVNMPNYLAERIYNWAPHGTDVWIHD